MTTWILIAIGALGMAGSLFYSINQWIDTNAELASVSNRLDEQTAKAQAAITVLASERDAMNRTSRRLKELESKRDDLNDALQAERTAREQLEASNEQYKIWADSRLPDAAISMLSDSPLYPHNRAYPMHQRQSADDTSVAPSQNGPDPQPTLGESDRSVRREPDGSERPDGSH